MQAAHALQELNIHFPDVIRGWHASSNYLVLLSASQERLQQTLLKAQQQGLPVCAFHEPDLNDQLTAIAIGPDGGRLVRKFPLAMKDK